MPIGSDAWDDSSDDVEMPSDTETIGDDDLAISLVTAFLARNAENAYTKREIFLGVNLEDNDNAFPKPEDDVEGTFADVQAQISRAAGSVVASGLVLGDIQDALDTLVSEDVVECREVETGGRTKRYYRLKQD